MEPLSPKSLSQETVHRERLRERIGFKRAAVAVARKLAVIMHAMLKTGEVFEPQPGAAT